VLPAMRNRCYKSFKTGLIRSLTYIANCNINMSIWNMKLGEKIRYLREVEGSLRGLNRPMTQQELVKAIRQELRKSISQSYLSQIENGARPHMTQSSRALLAKFFKVHPGFLVDDPEGYHTELTSDLRTTEGQLDVWLLQGSEKFVGDAEVSDVLIKAAREKDTRRCLLLLGAILDTPGLAERLLEALRPELMAGGNHRQEKHARAATAEGRRIR
jgi:transcriptional regulator with XRE-family HTH domain